MEFDAFSEEVVRALEPEVVQAVFEGAEDGEAIAAWDGSERKLAMQEVEEVVLMSLIVEKNPQSWRSTTVNTRYGKIMPEK